jgi:hypothetical protein
LQHDCLEQLQSLPPEINLFAFATLQILAPESRRRVVIVVAVQCDIGISVFPAPKQVELCDRTI